MNPDQDLVVAGNRFVNFDELQYIGGTVLRAQDGPHLFVIRVHQQDETDKGGDCYSCFKNISRRKQNDGQNCACYWLGIAAISLPSEICLCHE